MIIAMSLVLISQSSLSLIFLPSLLCLPTWQIFYISSALERAIHRSALEGQNKVGILWNPQYIYMSVNWNIVIYSWQLLTCFDETNHKSRQYWGNFHLYITWIKYQNKRWWNWTDGSRSPLHRKNKRIRKFIGNIMHSNPPTAARWKEKQHLRCQ